MCDFSGDDIEGCLLSKKKGLLSDILFVWKFFQFYPILPTTLFSNLNIQITGQLYQQNCSFTKSYSIQ